ncbi:hypothetical protein B0T14DRAFT_426755 [Immersiella caudata]|uniref:Nephrocystin 3-like N-terminal domain-containing protein n=1 Tax=Immersiella caudata TaxID=314043 RepID=A0AA40C3U5_9PEZI|nr:hypothetical protein B0T14DRAFT_426755 [Immersiella caudata]
MRWLLDCVLIIPVKDSERREICTWLERTNPSPLHNAAARRHEPRTSAWLRRTGEWGDWISASSPDRLFWIYGIPGAGKTMFYVVIDAVHESTPREELVRLIATMTLDNRFQKVRILAISRQYIETKRVFSGISISIPMANPFVDADIKSFVRARLAASHRLRRWNDSLQDIKKALIKRLKECCERLRFRWVHCQIQALERFRDLTQLTTVLENLPRGLNETYIRIFDAIPQTDRPFVRRVLTWIIGHSQAGWMVLRGIYANVLVEAVAYDIYGHGQPGFDLHYLQELLGCLITVETSDKDFPRGQQEAGCSYNSDLFVSLAHYTVLVFLTSPHILQTRVSAFPMSERTVGSQFGISILR